MTRWLAIAVALLAAGQATASQPADGWLAAWQDIQTLSPTDAKYTRYLWFAERETKLCTTNYLTLSGHLQGLSRRRRIVPPVAVLSDGSVRLWPNILPLEYASIVVCRINCLDYWPDASVWDRLGDPRLEPFFHVFTLVPYPAGRNPDGSAYPAGEEKTAAIAPWLLSPLGMAKGQEKTYRDAVLGLIVATDYSPCPIVEVTNFIWQTAIQFDRVAGYYDFLGVKDRKTFQKLVGFDEQASLDFALPQLEVVSVSDISQQPRRIEFWTKLGGSYIFTKDQVNQRAIGNRNPINNKGLNSLKFDAEETFASLPNGFWATGLFAADGTRQDSAPDGVGYQHFTVSNDGKIHVNLACLVCHDKRPGNGGLQPFTPYFRTLYAAPGPIALADPNPKILRALSDYYLTPLDLDTDRRRYIAALSQANGLLPNVYAGYLYEVFHRWDRPVDLDRAATYYGVTAVELQRSLGLQLKTFGKIDDINANFLKQPEQRQRIGIDQFVEAYNFGQLALRGLPTWPDDVRRKYTRRP